MHLTRKERMRRAINYEPVDRIPTQINYTAEMGLLMAGYFDVQVSDLPYILGNHMMRVGLCYARRFNEDG